MVEVFVPNGYCSKTFWGSNNDSGENNNIPETTTEFLQPFSVYHLSQPHFIKVKNDHLGASPFSRASASKSMQLLRKVLQPAINHDIVKVFEKYILVFREAAENACENMAREPFSSSGTSSLNVDAMVSKSQRIGEHSVAEVCQDSLNAAKVLFAVKESKNDSKTKSFEYGSVPGKSTPATIPTHVLHNGKRRVASPDFPWHKRLKNDDDVVTQRRSLSPVPKKRFKSTTPVVAPRRYGSPHRNTKESVRRKVENWDPSRITINTEFVMGTKANRALGLGATRGRIYMKHPDLFKYAGDHEDKKWMVKNHCMAATGGKNTFLMLAEDVMHLYENEYKDSPGTMPDELQFFKLPEFVLIKMRAAMINEKKIRIQQLTSASPLRDTTATSDSTAITHHPFKQSEGQRTVRQAAQVALQANRIQQSGSSRSDSDTDPNAVSDDEVI